MPQNLWKEQFEEPNIQANCNYYIATLRRMKKGDNIKFFMAKKTFTKLIFCFQGHILGAHSHTDQSVWNYPITLDAALVCIYTPFLNTGFTFKP